MPRQSKDPDYEARSVKSAERVLDILTLLTQCPNGMKLKDIARELHIPVSSLFAILTTMRKRGFVERDEALLYYRLSRNYYHQVTTIYSEDDLVSLAYPVMEEVQVLSGETVSLSVRVGTEIVMIGKRSSASVIQVVNALGSRLPAHATGSGKVMLAYLSEPELDRIYPEEDLPGYTPTTTTTKTDLKKILARIRDDGYAFDNEESIEGVWAIAGCIRAQDGSPLAATSIVVPSFRVTEENISNWQKLIVDGAAKITSLLGASASQQNILGQSLIVS